MIVLSDWIKHENIILTLRKRSISIRVLNTCSNIFLLWRLENYNWRLTQWYNLKIKSYIQRLFISTHFSYFQLLVSDFSFVLYDLFHKQSSRNNSPKFSLYLFVNYCNYSFMVFRYMSYPFIHFFPDWFLYCFSFAYS